MVSSPHPVPCIEPSSYAKDRAAALSRGSMISEGQSFRVPGSYVKGIACGGRHSAVITGMPRKYEVMSIRAGSSLVLLL